MTKKAYTTRTGAQQFKPVVSESELQELGAGFCLACGREVYGVEPDARKYTCCACGAPKVYGLEEGLLEVKAGGAK